MKNLSIYIEAKVAQAILQARERLTQTQVDLSLDLGLSTQSTLITKGTLEFNDQKILISEQDLQIIINKPRKVFKFSPEDESSNQFSVSIPVI